MDSFMTGITDYFSSEEFRQASADWALKILVVLAILIFGRWLAKGIRRWFRGTLNKRSVDATVVDFLGNLFYAVLITVIFVAALQVMGFAFGGVIAVLGAAGLAIALALKDSLGNFASGVMLIAFRPFGKGDLVEVAGKKGKVDQIRIFSTAINTNDNVRIIVPNGEVMANPIVNHTFHDVRRIDLTMGVGYDDDLVKTRDILESILNDHPLVLEDPAPQVILLELADSSVNFGVRPWVKTENYWAVWNDVLEISKERLEAAGMNIPYPQRDVHLHTVNPGE